MPFNIIEALGTGVPVVASDIKGHRDLLSGGAGVLYPEANREALVRAVISSLESDSMRYKAAEVYNSYSFDSVFELTYKSLKEALFCE